MDFKNNDLHSVLFDSDSNRPYYTRPMSPGLPDRVDCTRLADDAAILERVYPLAKMPRLHDLLADQRGSVSARFAFANVESGRAGASVQVRGTLLLLCQRCLHGFEYAVAGSSDIEFTSGEAAESVQSTRDYYPTEGGLVSLRDLAEEELLLAMPAVAACNTPLTCGRAPPLGTAGEVDDEPAAASRPFVDLRKLLKKT